MDFLKKLWTPGVKKALFALLAALGLAVATALGLSGCNSVDILVLNKARAQGSAATNEILTEIDAGATKQDTISPQTDADVSVVPGE